MKKVRQVVKRKELSQIREVSELSQPNKQLSLLTANYESLNSRLKNLSQIYQTLKSFESKKSASSKFLMHVSFLIQSIEPILSSYLYQVSKRSSETNEKMLEFVNNNNIEKELSILTRQTLSIFLFLSNIHSTLGNAMCNEDSNEEESSNQNGSDQDSSKDSSNSQNESNPDNNENDDSKPIAVKLNKTLSNEELKNFIIDGDEEHLTVLCRICEKQIPLDLVEKHTNLCIQAHQEKYNIINSDNQLEKINKKLSSLLTVNWPGNMNDAITTLYPLLFLYLTNEIAMSVKSFQNQDIELLDSLYQKLKRTKIPKSVEEYTSYFDNSRHFIKLLLDCSEIIAKQTKEIAKTTADHSVGDLMKQAKLSDFQFLCRLSAGAFARVYLAQKESTGDLYAIKVITQSRLNLKNQVRRVETERDIMMKLHSPYMVNFYYSFMPKNNLYLVMEYIPGGDIYSLLQSIGSLDEDSARTYIVQVIKALQFLRQNNIIHCDLKPDNILIDANGYIRVTDFGLSFDGQSGRQLTNLVGTPDYMAPEIILMQKHSFSCDYWSLGVMVFEMLYGTPPFHGQTEEETLQKVLSAEYDLNILEDVSDECKDFISRLLISDPSQRIGADRFEDIMEHKWFEGIDWDNVLSMEPVFVPDMEQIEETRDLYFQSRYSFSDASEKDIREDLELDKQPEEKNEPPRNLPQRIYRQRTGYSRTRNAQSRKDSGRKEEMKIESNANNSKKKNNNSTLIHQNDKANNEKASNDEQKDEQMQLDESISSSRNANESTTKMHTDFQKISLQHLRTIGEDESIRLHRKRSNTTAANRSARPNLDLKNGGLPSKRKEPLFSQDDIIQQSFSHLQLQTYSQFINANSNSNATPNSNPNSTLDSNANPDFDSNIDSIPNSYSYSVAYSKSNLTPNFANDQNNENAQTSSFNPESLNTQNLLGLPSNDISQEEKEEEMKEDIHKAKSLTESPRQLNQEIPLNSKFSTNKSSGIFIQSKNQIPQGKVSKKNQLALPRRTTQPPQKVPLLKFHNVLFGSSSNMLKPSTPNLAVPSVQSTSSKILFNSQTSITTHSGVISSSNRPNLAVPKNVNPNTNLQLNRLGQIHLSSSFSNLVNPEKGEKLFSTSDDKCNTSDTSDDKFESAMKPSGPSSPITVVETKSGRFTKAPLPPIPLPSTTDIPSLKKNENSLLIHNA